MCTCACHTCSTSAEVSCLGFYATGHTCKYYEVFMWATSVRQIVYIIRGNTPSWHNQDFSMYIDQYICRVTVSQHSNVCVCTLCCVVQRSQSSR